MKKIIFGEYGPWLMPSVIVIILLFFVTSYCPWQAFQPSLMLQVRPEPAQVMQIKVSPLQGRLLALPTHISLGWKLLPDTNTCLFQTFVNYGRKRFKTLTPGKENRHRRRFVSSHEVAQNFFELCKNPIKLFWS